MIATLGKQNVHYNHSCAIADHMAQTGHGIKWDQSGIWATGQSDIHCKIKETLLIRDLKPALSFTFSLSLLSLFDISLCAII